MKNAYRKWMAQRLKYFRQIIDQTQAELAAQIGIKLRTYQSYEEGRAEPSIFTLKNFCSVVRITVDFFLETSPEKETVKD